MPHRQRRSVTAAVLALAATALALGAADAAAQERDTLAAEIAACRMLEDPTERLRCYDEAAEAEAEEGEVVVEEGRAVLELAGSGDFDSDSFTTEAPWHLRWVSEGSIMTVELRDFTGEMITILGNQIGRGEGRSEVSAPGDYILAVRALGDWQLWVIEGD